MLTVIDANSNTMTADVYQAIVKTCHEKVSKRISDDIKADPSIDGEVAMMYLDLFKKELLQIVKEVE